MLTLEVQVHVHVHVYAPIMTFDPKHVSLVSAQNLLVRRLWVSLAQVIKLQESELPKYSNSAIPKSTYSVRPTYKIIPISNSNFGYNYCNNPHVDFNMYMYM